MRWRSVIACAGLAPLLTAAAQPDRLQPSSPWVLEYAENSCRLIRSFGEGSDKTILAFESDAPGEMDLLVVGKSLHGYTDEVPAHYLPVRGKPMKGRASLSTRDGQSAILWSPAGLFPQGRIDRIEKMQEERKSHPGVRPSPLDLADEASKKLERQEFATNTTGLEIEARRGHPVILETGSLGAAIKMFDTCSRDSLRDWGVDPNLEDKIVRPVWAASPWKWFSPSDYPTNMVVFGQESEVKVRLLVDASGKPTKCTSLSHFEAKDFNKVVCEKFMTRASFEPAELADGTKVASYYTTRVDFQLER